jgi:hypothetical protein
VLELQCDACGGWVNGHGGTRIDHGLHRRHG